MSNFWKKQVAQESANAALEPGSIELPEEAVETHLAEVQEDTAEIELLDRDGAILADDADETDAQIELIDEGEESGEDMTEAEVESLDVAQESIRKRWGIERRSVAQESAGSSRSRRVVARESLVDDAKTLIKRFIEWLKELGRKAKERWLKFHNAGKTIQGRSKKFEAKLRNLGTKKKDTITGGFIKMLSKDGKFVGDNAAELKSAMKMAQDTQDVQAKMYEGLATGIPKLLDGEGGNFKDTLNADGLFGNGPTQVLGNYVVQRGEEDEAGTPLEFVESQAEVADEVPTPASTLLASLNDIYNLVGKELEKQLQAFRKTEKAQADLEKAMEKILSAIGKAEGEDSKAAKAKAARKIAQTGSSRASIVSKIGAHLWKTLPSGINGYIAAGIGAYGK